MFSNEPIRGCVVGLLTQVEAAVGEPLTRWTYTDGRTVTAQDAAALASATAAEAQAAANLLLKAAVELDTSNDAARRWSDLVGPYFAAHPQCFTVEELLQHMAPADQDELDILAGVLGVTYKDR